MFGKKRYVCDSCGKKDIPEDEIYNVCKDCLLTTEQKALLGMTQEDKDFVLKQKTEEVIPGLVPKGYIEIKPREE